VLSLIGILGGIGAGLDHVGPAAGAKRGLLAGSIFGGAILIAHEIHGADAKADLPHPAILLVVVTTVLAVLFAAFGGWIRRRQRLT
jgi:predicted lysophospholipase L1 biosynthesis ABC-type transport system permease subunit